MLLSKAYQTESEKVRENISKLEATIKDLNSKNGRLQIAILILTVATVIATTIQVLIAFKG